MNYEIVTLESKTIAGLSIRTSNHQPDMGAKIGGLWQQLYGQGILAGIPGRVGQSAFGLYTHYERDADGEYDVIAGCQVQAPVQNDRLVCVEIPAGRYARFSIVANMHGDGVGALWGDIWNTPLNRAFTVDFEEYLPCEDMEKAPVHIYIALAE